MPLKLVPFNPAWTNNANLNIRAIYRRPQTTEDEYGQRTPKKGPDGETLWDLTGPLRVLEHSRWTTKGFEYVTLASFEDLVSAARAGTVKLLPGMGSWKDYSQHQMGGPWHWKMYLDGQSTEEQARAAQLEADVEKYGPDVVEDLRKRTDPDFTLPEHLKAKKGKREKAVA